MSVHQGDDLSSYWCCVSGNSFRVIFFFDQVSIYLPPLKRFRNVVERMKAMSNHVVSQQRMNKVLNCEWGVAGWGVFRVSVQFSLCTWPNHKLDHWLPLRSFHKQYALPNSIKITFSGD